MKKHFGLIIAFALLLSLSGCNNNAGVGNGSNTASNEISTAAEDNGLTNPGEYLADLCSNVKIGDIELSLPCTFEKMSESFTLTPIESEPPSDKFSTSDYGIFTKENKYFGMMSFVYNDERDIEIWLMSNDYRKQSISLLGEDIQTAHLNDKSIFTVGDFVSGETKRNEIVSKLGKGFVSEPKINEGEYYDFEDGTLVIVYDGDTAIEFHVSLCI